MQNVVAVALAGSIKLARRNYANQTKFLNKNDKSVFCSGKFKLQIQFSKVPLHIVFPQNPGSKVILRVHEL